MKIGSAVSLPLVLFLSCAPTSFAAAPEKVPGDEWEATVKMSMPGMPMQMPATTSKFCRAKNRTWDEPPMDRQSQDRCKMSDYRLTGNHATWKMTCQGGMTGTGDITYAADSYAGTITLDTEQGSMKMELSGRRTGKDCDGMEMTRTVERMKKQAAEAEEYAPGGSKDPMIAICKDGAASGNRTLFIGAGAQCKKPEDKAAFCTAAKSRKAFDELMGTYCRGDESVLTQVATFCGTTGDAIKKGLCPQAVASKDLEFVGCYCPAEGKGLAAEYCAGRKFTSIPEETIRTFCTRYSEKLLSGK